MTAGSVDMALALDAESGVAISGAAAAAVAEAASCGTESPVGATELPPPAPPARCFKTVQSKV